MPAADAGARVPGPSIDVLIVTQRAGDLLISCLEHLEHQTIPHNVHVADNASGHAGIADELRERFPRVRLTANAENLGFGRALNRLARQADGDVIVLVNDDMEVEPQFLERLVEPLSDTGVGMVAGLTLQSSPDATVDGFGIEADPTLLAFNRLRHRSADDRPGRLLGPSGGAAAYRRAAWDTAGGFDEHLFVYGEDVDLALRLRLGGWRAAAAPDARGVHFGGVTAGVDSPFQRHHAGFARGFLLRRYGVLRGRHALRALLVEALTVAWGVVRFGTTVPLRARLAGWRAARDGPRLTIPRDAVDETIGLREALRRLRHER